MTLFVSFVLTLVSFCSGIQPGAEKGIVYFSADNGQTWENKSKGLPDGIFLSDIAVAPGFLGLSTKYNGIFLFNFQKDEWSPLEAIPVKDDEINTLYFHRGKILVGTKNNGVFISPDAGKSWMPYSKGLKNHTIRKLVMIGKTLYAGSNNGLYVLDELNSSWLLVYGGNNLQVNGIRELDGNVYIGTNQGIFKRSKNETVWKQIMPNRSLHNLGVDRKNIYALTYSELFISSDGGASWLSSQKGMPPKYTFQVIEKDNTVLAGQWDGVYVKTSAQGWKLSNNGLPPNFPVLELVVNGSTVVAGSSQWSE